VIDFGGAAAPLGYGAEIVDRLSEHKALYDLPGQADVIFSSHTLEHVQDPALLLEIMRRKLTAGGPLVVMVPSWRMEHLRAENFPFHCQTFCLSDDAAAANTDYTRLDLLVENSGFQLLAGEDDGQNILIIAESPPHPILPPP
jgi:SAM-dependent methyltransferase